MTEQILSNETAISGQNTEQVRTPGSSSAIKTIPTQHLQALRQYFDRYPTGRRHRPLDPAQLPWHAPKATPRAPAETRTAWFQKLYRDQKIQLAPAATADTGASGLRFDIAPEPGQDPTPADLAPTDDVPLTPAIQAKAAELGHNPVNIYNWVRNHVEYAPTWGSIQGADGTLKTLRANALDTASLLIALLRASSIPARYQFGTVDLPAQQAMNWVGGVHTAQGALDLMYQGGLAARGLVSGGRITTVRMEHVWVNAYVNWSPARGSKNATETQHPNPNAQLNAWVPMDASYKQYIYTPGMDLQSAVPLDANAFLAAVQQGANLTPAYVQN